MSDPQLARRAASGERRALAEVFERHHQAIYRYCRSLLGSDADAQDALQNTMVRVVRALPGEKREIALKPWLYRIAHNESLRILGARRPHEPLEAAPEIAAPDQAAGAEARERLAALVADLQELPERARSAIVLRELNGASFQEIAETFGVSPAAAKQAVYDARIALHDCEAGRAMDCGEVTRAVSDGDGRRLRQRKMRAHLRACGDCRAFQATLECRSTDLRALAPPLAPVLAAGLLSDLLGGSGGGTAAGAATAATAATKAGGSAAAVTATKMTTAAVAAKGLAVAAVTAAAGAGVLQAGHVGDSRASQTPTSVSGQAAADPGSTPLERAAGTARAARPVEKRARPSEGPRRERAARQSRNDPPMKRGDVRVTPDFSDGQRWSAGGRRPDVPQADRREPGSRGLSPSPTERSPAAPPDLPPPAKQPPAPRNSPPPRSTSPEVPVDSPDPVTAPTAPAAAPTAAPEVPAVSGRTAEAPAENFSR